MREDELKAQAVITVARIEFSSPGELSAPPFSGLLGLIHHRLLASGLPVRRVVTSVCHMVALTISSSLPPPWLYP